jgi:hypothetical protein
MQEEWPTIRWDTGIENKYRFGHDGKFDIAVINPDQPVLLSKGQRVVRGGDWKWDEQDGKPGSFGSVTKDMSPGETWVDILWDGGVSNSYRAGGGFRDVVCLQMIGEEAMPSRLIRGHRVIRGRTWKWEMQDGGLGIMGEVVEDQPVGSEWVKVLWPNGISNSYRYRQGSDSCDLIVIGWFGPPGMLQRGMRVVRGPTWKWEGQDGGAGCFGTIVENQKPDVWNIILHTYIYIHQFLSAISSCFEFLFQMHSHNPYVHVVSSFSPPLKHRMDGQRCDGMVEK